MNLMIKHLVLQENRTVCLLLLSPYLFLWGFFFCCCCLIVFLLGSTEESEHNPAISVANYGKRMISSVFFRYSSYSSYRLYGEVSLQGFMQPSYEGILKFCFILFCFVLFFNAELFFRKETNSSP